MVSTTPTSSVVETDKGALSDEDIAMDLMEQSKSMTSQAKAMMKEADRLKNEARVLQGKKPIKKTAKKKTSA